MNSRNIKKLVATSFLLLAGLTSLHAHAHGKLESSSPKAAEVLDQSPKEIRIQFNENLEGTFSKIQLLDAKKTALALDKSIVDKTNPKIISVAVPNLSAGDYQVQWTAMTQDGHKTKGTFSFKVK